MKGLSRLLIALATITVLGVDRADAQPRILFRAGATLATIRGADVTAAHARTGVRVGLSATFAISDDLGVEVGGAYAEKGAARRVRGMDATFKLDYMELPVLFRLGIPTLGFMSPHVLLGPAVALEVGCNSAGGDQALPCNSRGAEVKAVDVGAMAGAGFSLPISGPLSVSLEVFYDVGLVSIDDSASPEDVKNRAWSFLVGVGFPIEP